VSESQRSAGAADRRAQLVAAAETLVEWMHLQRAGWDELDAPLPAAAPPAREPARPTQARGKAVPKSQPPPAAPTPVVQAPAAPRSQTRPPSRAVVAAPVPVAATPPPVVPAPPPLAAVALPPPAAAVVAPEPEPTPSPPEPALPRRVWLAVRQRARSLAPPVLRWSWRAGLAAAAVVVFFTAGGAAWQYGHSYWAALNAPPKPGTALIESEPPGSAIAVDGVTIGVSPVSKVLQPGRHLIEFRRRDAVRKLEIEIVPEKSTLARVDWTTKPTGTLVVSSDPVGARVSVDGRVRGTTPLTLTDLTVGAHVVLLEADKGSVRRTVTITEEGPTQLSESIYAGWVHVSSPFEVTLTEGTRRLALDARSEVLLAAGTHDLVLENRALGFRERRRVEVTPGLTAPLAIQPRPSMLDVTATLPSDVFVDGVRAGATPLSDYPVAIGARDILVRSQDGSAERRVTLTITVSPARLNVDFSEQ
jgi:hypothetical protein